MAEEYQVTCGNCGNTKFTIDGHGARVWDPMRKQLVYTTGSFKLTCTFCERFVAFWYGDRGWSYDRIFTTAKRILEQPVIDVKKGKWPRHLESCNSGKKFYEADRTLPKNAFISCGFCGSPKNYLTAFCFENEHDVFQIICRNCGRLIVISYNDRGFRHARAYKLLSNWYVRKEQPKGKLPTHLKLFKEGSLKET